MATTRTGKVYDFYKFRKGVLSGRKPHIKWRPNEKFSEEELDELRTFIREDYGEGYVIKQKRVILHVYIPSRVTQVERTESYNEDNDCYWKDYGSEESYWECNGI